MNTRALAAFGLICLAAVPSLMAARSPETPRFELTGNAAVVDGDTLDLGGVRIRLFAIDAPEFSQDCTLPSGAKWPCGLAATMKLGELISRQTITCHRRDTDRYGRTIAVCYAGETDIGKAMVGAGLAIAYRRYSDAYIEDENAARLLKVGLWSGAFIPPEQYRREREARR